MTWEPGPNKTRTYNNIGPISNFIDETQSTSQNALFWEKEFFPGACNTCGTMSTVTGVPLKSCAGCQLVSYCNKSCQASDWKIHKIVCKKFPIEKGNNIIVRKTDSIREDRNSFLFVMVELTQLVFESKDLLKNYIESVCNIFLNPRVCNFCREARREKLFDCRCCFLSYCSESHRMKDPDHSSKDCDILYAHAMANWYLMQHHQLQIPDGLLNEVNLNDGLKFEKVSKMAKYSSEKWLETIINLINERITFPLTIHHVLKNLKLGEHREDLSEITSLTIHIVHEKPMLDPRMWEFLLHQLPKLKILNLTFINHEMKLYTPYNSFLPLERCSDCKRNQRVINYNIQSMQYHEYFSSDDYVHPDVVAVFDNYLNHLLADDTTWKKMLESGETAYKTREKAQLFVSLGNMTYSKHTVVILTDGEKKLLKERVKSFHDSRPVKVLVPVQKNPFYINRFVGHNNFFNLNLYLCCVQRNY